MSDVRKQIRDNLSRLIRQPGGDSLTQDQDGVLVATVVYKCDWNQVLSLMPRRYRSQHPDFSNLYCDTVTASRESPGIAVLTVTYTGADASDGSFGADGEDTITELSVGLSQEPIEVHPDFQDWAGTPDSPVTGAEWDDDGFFKGFTQDNELNLFGVTNYLEPTGTFRRSYVTSTQPSAVSVGAIDTPTGAPTMGGGRNWLTAGMRWIRSGGVYRVSEEWISSARGGWNGNIYDS